MRCECTYSVCCKCARLTFNIIYIFRRVCDLCWSRQNDVLLASYQSDILKIWDVQNNRILNSSVKLHSSIFDAAWISDQDVNEEGLLITAALDNTNKINVSNYRISVPIRRLSTYSSILVFSPNKPSSKHRLR